MARKKIEENEKVCAPVPESDPVLKLCEQIADTLKLIQSDLTELKKRFV